MLSGLSSQLGGLITSVKGGKPEEESSEETADKKQSRSGSTSAEQSQQQQSGLLSLRSNLPSWLGGGNKDAATENVTTTEDESAATVHSNDASSSATAADSEKERTTTTLDDASTTKQSTTQSTPPPDTNTDRVKNLGSLFSTGLSNLGSTIKGAGQKIKETNPLTSFQKEQSLFIQKAKSSMGSAVTAPWVGFEQEEAFKEEVLGLSGDRRNFVRSPPAGVQFDWNYEEMLPVAKAILKEDPALEKMRFELVPKVVNEENFWKNYFYRVMLLRGSLESKGTKRQDSIDTDDDEDEEGNDPELEKELEKELEGFEVVNKSSSKKEELLDLK